MRSAWALLVLAGLMEVCWAIGLKYTKGFTCLVPSIFTLVTLSLSMFLLAKATETLPIGTAYSVWVGIGALGACIMEMLLFGQPLIPLRLFFMILLLISILGLKVFS